MIVCENLWKVYRTQGEEKVVARDINAVFPTGIAVALLGRNGAGKSTLMRLIAGNQKPTSGRIWSDGTISWPVGFAGSFHGELTGAQNVRFVARIYGVDTDMLNDFVEDFAELGPHFHYPFRTYSSGMRSRLAFGVSMGIRFDTYLVDEVTSVGDEQFRRKASALFKRRIGASGAIVVSHSMAVIRDLCSKAAVLENGRLTMYDDVEQGIAHHMENMK
ncbi:Polysialic acid transport ATP-binding protein KpsT [Aliiroseovarius sp. xm-m-379]|uniref:ABC transporter ATP-binding protein n=1 Tax=Aliiroseovarius crassostreae TaxID=154981 RepID=A0A9Q9HD59_9RHOB|nr:MULTISPECIES: ABC transporter ATP-binding protein [Aliiroseovarius]NRP23392.1 Polysialic acid transport ATP-binding protein KpsT [Aliiroseovarius sp. xm-m-379]NRP32191.1 Polysialic acid transport ATP-binding protein KpsT [Aliiroseovarius sp. xm-a-104]NRP44086.1 Polysialic acid transport ATP-binding protein KpsT [Aliiroseovarius sp. xm-m-378]NRP48612.1 Polysialic acid transport ATP-binding protein KpsT [Aliiroseovarius sp. xm-m-354]NRP64957.1 Polysialic acid transport ATP-binding protein Kps